MNILLRMAMDVRGVTLHHLSIPFRAEGGSDIGFRSCAVSTYYYTCLSILYGVWSSVWSTSRGEPCHKVTAVRDATEVQSWVKHSYNQM